MTVEELREERDRTRPAWEAKRIDVRLLFEHGELRLPSRSRWLANPLMLVGV